MEVVKNERDLLQQADRVASLSECFTRLQQCDECIERLEKRRRVKRSRLTVGHGQDCATRECKDAITKPFHAQRW